MVVSDQHVTELGRGVACSFAGWPNPSVPAFGAGVYTIWHNDGRFIYVGMSGRGITAETIRRNTPQGISPKSCQRTPEWRPVLRLRGRPACSTNSISTGHCCYRVGTAPNGRVRAPIHPREPLLQFCDGPGWSNGLHS